ncbi:hypothetical protein M427DRAFT_221806 [Gonapodya prolifera JEL478]|uniref:Uncharacterized protein n=1 Tax=Gonapodya prolifera (strain JEL478) TaxID=1344416 RepID=A0A139AMU9_GONPJ|nr:hypothetical protein M427DRAFT_221806 [Gonapodya prolifera JEL478]|eukprot:KXS18091.1 hypothetical protein M427DRAFT_221806 [Gonapodya prolifera JEL478]
MSDNAPTRHDQRYAGASRVLRACIVSSDNIAPWTITVSKIIAGWGTAQTLHVLRWLFLDREVGQGMDADEGFVVAMASLNHPLSSIRSASRSLVVSVAIRAIGDVAYAHAHTFPTESFITRFPLAFLWCEKEIDECLQRTHWTRPGLLVALVLLSRLVPPKDESSSSARLKTLAKLCITIACKCELAGLREIAGRAAAGVVTARVGEALVKEVTTRKWASL